LADDCEADVAKGINQIVDVRAAAPRVHRRQPAGANDATAFFGQATRRGAVEMATDRACGVHQVDATVVDRIAVGAAKGLQYALRSKRDVGR
jgi:hypothetical protein